jgi:four helix bundle protein
VAKGSAGELRSQLFIAKDIGYMDKSDFKVLLNSATTVSKQISGFIEYLKTAEFKGQKFKIQ